MLEQLQSYFYIIAIYLPIGFIGLWRWSVWIAKKIVARNYKPIAENGYKDTLSIIVPVYNEEPDVFIKALDSWLKNEPDEIIAVIDYSDKACIDEFKKFQEKNENAKLIITEKPGKRAALSDGIKASGCNIVALVDSDTIWDPDIKKTLLSPFNDPSVGGVGPRQDVLEGNTLARRLFNIHLDQRYFDELSYLSTVSNALTCVSGRTAVYRREAVKDLCAELENETFWGAKCISGDDKCLTRLIQERGWKSKYQGNARVLTPGAPDLATLFKQQIRWIRNTHRSDLKSLMSDWIWKREKFLAFHMIDRFTQMFTIILGPIYFVLSIIWGHWLVAAVLLAWWHFSRGIKIYPHLKNHPSDILILPFYVVTTYLLAILKIYALVTIGQQGWITRWDKGRLESKGNRLLLKIKSYSPYIATLSIVALISFGVASYKNFAADVYIVRTPNHRNNTASALSIVKNLNLDNLSDEDIREYKQKILDNLENGQYGLYAIKKKDTLWKIALRYNSGIYEIVAANGDTIIDPDRIEIGQRIVIPVSELRNVLDRSSLTYRGPSEIVFDELENTIVVKGEGSLATLSEIDEIIDDQSILEELENKEWVLKANIFVTDNATLMIDNEDVSWLKLKSDDESFVWIDSKDGNILIKDTKITSWDESKGSFDFDHKGGRSFVSVKYNSRMDIINSEMAFLGFDGKLKDERFAGGGTYGVSWKIPGGTFEENLVTGSVVNSRFHNNYFGAYTFGATGMVFRDNKSYDNYLYGFDLHDDSNNFIIEGNTVWNNGSHGIILSKYSFNNLIRGNVSYDNKLHGIMLHQESNSNILENNDIHGNVDGIVVYNSHSNLIRNNKIKDNKSGVRANVNSSGNYIEQNRITNNNNGVFLYDDADNNIVFGNLVKDNKKGVYIKNADGNFIENGLKEASGEEEIMLENGSVAG